MCDRCLPTVLESINNENQSTMIKYEDYNKKTNAGISESQEYGVASEPDLSKIVQNMLTVM